MASLLIALAAAAALLSTAHAIGAPIPMDVILPTGL
ncbi:MAG: hypothetical protein JWM87_2518 [Candidatus Eremiobacteraeota bacterium]|nr:hypothetical protein [Candidatus Eremiobacteraeota bacterium]